MTQWLLPCDLYFICTSVICLYINLVIFFICIYFECYCLLKITDGTAIRFVGGDLCGGHGEALSMDTGKVSGRAPQGGDVSLGQKCSNGPLFFHSDWEDCRGGSLTLQCASLQRRPRMRSWGSGRVWVQPPYPRPLRLCSGLFERPNLQFQSKRPVGPLSFHQVLIHVLCAASSNSLHVEHLPTLISLKKTRQTINYVMSATYVCLLIIVMHLLYFITTTFH